MDYSLIWDWLISRESGEVFVWWLLVTLAGAAVWPLLFRVMGGLPDRGYTLARAAGLMLTGFIFWYLGSLGLLRNTPGGMVFAWLVVLALGLTAFFRWDDRPSLREWVREHRALIILTEIVFLVSLYGWAIYRAHNPEMYSTEKPMEIMFLNGIRHSDTFPPRDPWLSGYSISYYYFGYVIMAMLADLSGVASGLAFNITNALLFSLTGIGTLGVVYNLVRAGGRRIRGGSQTAALLTGMLGLCFVVLMGNLGTALVEFPYQGYAPALASKAYFDFWDVEERYTGADAYGNEITTVPDSDADGIPDWDDRTVSLDRWRFMGGLGWRYSRTIRDRDLSGRPIGIQPIAEFPNFSFALADNHPHVLALPFALLAIGLALNLVLGGRELERFEYPLYAIWVGGMVFMNSWDVVYVPLLIGAEVLRRLVRNGTGTLSWEDVWKTARFALIVAGLTAIFYMPWFLSFTSQAGGILPNLVFPTKWQQFFLQFGTFLVILAVFLGVEIRRAGWRFNGQAALLAFVAVISTTIIIVAIRGKQVWDDPSRYDYTGARYRAAVDIRNSVYMGVSPTDTLGDAIPDILNRRLNGLPSELLLVGMMAVVVGRLFARPLLRVYPSGENGEDDDAEDSPELGQVRLRRTINYSPATGFALLLVGAGAVLTFGPDFLYLQDNFTVRINTVFKLYYQGWIMFSLASAFAVWSVLAGVEQTEPVKAGRTGQSQSNSEELVPLPVFVGRVVFGMVVIAFFVAGMTYPVLATRARALVNSGRQDRKNMIEACENQQIGGQKPDCPEMFALQLDGVPTMVGPDDLGAIQCLAGLETDDDAVLLEAPGGAYEPHNGRFSALTGIPTLMGWQGHERQWRGGTYDKVTDLRVENGQLRSRVDDVREIYTTENWDRAWALIKRYGIDYIVIGPSERSMIDQMITDQVKYEQDPVRQAELLEELTAHYEAGLNKFGEEFIPVCLTGETLVYRVAPS